MLVGRIPPISLVSWAITTPGRRLAACLASRLLRSRSQGGRSATEGGSGLLPRNQGKTLPAEGRREQSVLTLLRSLPGWSGDSRGVSFRDAPTFNWSDREPRQRDRRAPSAFAHVFSGASSCVSVRQECTRGLLRNKAPRDFPSSCRDRRAAPRPPRGLFALAVSACSAVKHSCPRFGLRCRRNTELLLDEKLIRPLHARVPRLGLRKADTILSLGSLRHRLRQPAVRCALGEVLPLARWLDQVLDRRVSTHGWLHDDADRLREALVMSRQEVEIRRSHPCASTSNHFVSFVDVLHARPRSFLHHVARRYPKLSMWHDQVLTRSAAERSVRDTKHTRGANARSQRSS